MDVPLPGAAPGAAQGSQDPWKTLYDTLKVCRASLSHPHSEPQEPVIGGGWRGHGSQIWGLSQPWVPLPHHHKLHVLGQSRFVS